MKPGSMTAAAMTTIDGYDDNDYDEEGGGSGDKEGEECDGDTTMTQR